MTTADELEDLRAELAAARAEVERVTLALDVCRDREGSAKSLSERRARDISDLHDDVSAATARAEKAEAEVERLHVQLAGCSVAASGTDLDLSSDAYGWSVAFSDVAGLYRRMEKAEAEVERLRAENARIRADHERQCDPLYDAADRVVMAYRNGAFLDKRTLEPLALVVEKIDAESFATIRRAIVYETGRVEPPPFGHVSKANEAQRDEEER